jgi:outer membrane PBP1 activator LpoA protein
MLKNIFGLTVALMLLGLGGCSSMPPMFNFQNTPSPTILQQPLTDDSTLWQMNSADIWHKLQHTSLPHLQTALSKSKDTNENGWLKLALISKQYSTDTTQLVNQLLSWRKEFPNHPANSLLISDSELNALLNTPQPQHIGLLLPLQGTFAAQGKAVRDGFLSAYYEALAKNHQQQMISFYDTSTAQDMHVLYQRAIAEGVDMIIGPLTKDNVQALASQSEFTVPTIELNYTDLWAGSLATNLYQFGLSPQDEAQQVADKARQAGTTHALIIAPQDDWGQRTTKALTARWQSVGGSVAETYYFTADADLTQDIAALLHVDAKSDRAQMRAHKTKDILEQQRRHDFDVIFLLAQPAKAREIVPLLKYYYVENIPIFATSSIYEGFPQPAKDTDLNGIIFCDTPWTLLSLAKGGTHADRLFAVGRDAYLLSHELPRLMQLPNFPIYGATGALTLNPQHQIYRRLPWTKMHDGHP